MQSTAFTCGHILAQSVAQLPWHVNRRVGETREAADNRIESWLLKNEPNEEMTSYQFRYAGLMKMCFHGAWATEIVRDRGMRTSSLRPFFDETVLPLRTPDRERRLVGFEVTYLDGSKRRLPYQDVIYVPCIALDGVAGQSIIKQIANKVGLELAAEKSAGKLFNNGSRPSGILETDTPITDPSKRKEIEDSWQAVQAGVDNVGKTPVLAGGLKWKQITIDPDDAQLLETRAFQVADIARGFRIPGVLLGLADKTATYASVEQFLLSFAKFTLAPWLICIEQEFNRKLFPNSTEYYSKIDLRGLERADIVARGTFYKTMTETGAYTANRILALEDENGFEGGDVHLQGSGMTLYGSATTQAPKDEEEEPKPAKQSKQDQDDEEQKSLMVFEPVVNSAVATIVKSTKRDRQWIRSRMEPVLSSMSRLVGRQWNFNEADKDKFFDDMAQRAKDWTDASSADELQHMIGFVGGLK